MVAVLASSRAYTVHFQDLARWDIKTARAVRFYREHPSFRPLSEFAEEATEIVRPREEGEHEWPVYGVNNETGVFLSHLQRGEAFNAPYKRIRKDWFFHNPTRANVGSLGRVPDVPADAITSPEYQVWRIRRGITPDFMELLLRMPFFLKMVDFHRVGAVKERLFVQNLLEIRIPTLPEARQAAAVAHWRNAQEAAAKSRDTIVALEADTELNFFRILGIRPPRILSRPKVLAVLWRDMPRWSVSTVVDCVLGLHTEPRASFRYVKLGDVASVSYGIQKSPANRPGPHARPYLRVANVRKGYLDLSEIKTIEVPDSEMDSLRLRLGDVLFVEGNGSRAELGRVAMWNGEISDCVHQNHLIKVRCDTTLLLPEFAMAWFNTNVGRGHFFRSAKTSSGLGTINSSEVRTAPMPLPPLEVQCEIVNMVNRQRARIAEERNAAEERQVQATRGVEEMILGIRSVG